MLFHSFLNTQHTQGQLMPNGWSNYGGGGVIAHHRELAKALWPVIFKVLVVGEAMGG